MTTEKALITVATARLIIGYLHNRLSESEKDALDNWITISDENMEIFERLTKDVDENVFDPDQLIVDTEQVMDLWIISALIIRRHRNMNNEVEEKYLDEWIEADSQNKTLYKKLQHPAHMRKMLVWNKLKRNKLLAL